MMTYGWPNFNLDFLAGDAKKDIYEAPRAGGAASGSLIKIGGTDAPQTSQTIQETLTFSPTTTTTDSRMWTTTSTYAPVYAPTVSIIEGSPDATISKKDTITPAPTQISPVQYFPIDSGGTAVMPAAGGAPSSDALSPLGRLADNATGITLVVGVVAVGGLILFARTGGRRGGRR